MSDVIGLDLGQQTQAGRAVMEAADACVETLQSLYRGLETHAPGFRGAAASGFAEAVGTWAESAQQLPQVHRRYASALATVDETTAAADAAGSNRLDAAGSGLNMS